MEMFKCTKLKIHSNGHVEIHDDREINEGPTKEKVENKKKSSVTPHEDLQKSLDELKPYLAECFGINYADEYTTAEGLSDDKAEAFKIVKPILRREYKSILNEITITGISLSGNVDKRSVVITGIKLQPNKSKTALNSPNIRLTQKSFGFEDELSDVIAKILVEIELYHTGKKKAQYEMFDDNEDQQADETKMEKVA